MRRSVLFPLAALVSLALAACSGPNATMPRTTVTGVSPSELTVDTESFVVDGANFFQYPGGDGTRAEFCGVSVTAELIDPSSRTITLAPAGRVTVEAGDRIRVAVPTGAFQPGVSDLRLVRPDGSVTVVEGAVNCVAAPTEEPQPNRAPTASVEFAGQAYGDGSRVVTYGSTSTDPDGDELSYAWEAWSIPMYGEEAPEPEPVVGVADGGTFVITRPDADFHFLRLTVTDPGGLSDSVMFVTMLDPLGDAGVAGVAGGLVPQQVDESPIDAVRTSWTLDADRTTTLFELEAASGFTLPAYDPGTCSGGEPVHALGSMALRPQQLVGLPELIGFLVFLPGVDLFDPAAGEVSTSLVMAALPSNEDGTFSLLDSTSSDLCDPEAALVRVTPSVDDRVLSFGIPSELVGVDSLMFGLIGSTGGSTDIVPDGLLPLL